MNSTGPPGAPAAALQRGLALLQANRPDEAVDELMAVMDAAPGHRYAALFLGRALRLADRSEEAVPWLQQAAKDQRLEIEARYELARSLVRSRRARDAIEQYRRILQLQPDHAHAQANLAFLLEKDNRLDEAETAATEALRLSPGLGMAQLSLATVERRTGRADRAERRLRRYLANEPNPVNRSLAFNQLAQCLESRQAHSDAFEAWSSANRILVDHHPAARAEDQGSYGLHTLGRIHDWLEAHPPASWSVCEPSDMQPIFLVGFPRSGTTLLDRALSAHPQVEVLEEIELLDSARRRLVDGGRLNALHQASAEDLAAARRDYEDQLAAHRMLPDRPVVVDKLPLNLAYLFLLRRLYPEARVIFLLRDPRDVVLSCFFQSFELQGAMPYFLDLDQAAAYYDQLMKLAMLQRQTLGLAIHELRYEALVTSFEVQLRGVLDFLGLPWHADVQKYRQKAADRAIDTPSYQQVSQPLYQSSIGRWKAYRSSLEPVLPRLEAWATQFGYS